MNKNLIKRTPIQRRPFTILDYLIFPKEMIKDVTDEEADMLFDYYWNKVQKACGFKNYIVSEKKLFPRVDSVARIMLLLAVLCYLLSASQPPSANSINFLTEVSVLTLDP